MRRLLISIAALILSGSLTTSCSTNSKPIAVATLSSLEPEASATGSTSIYDYPSYSSLDELAGMSTAMVRGVVTDIKPSILNGHGIIDPVNAKGALDWVVTPISVKVTEHLAGDGYAAGSEVRILRQGGKIGARSEPTPEQEPLMEVGQQVVLFIASTTSKVGGVNAILVGGTQGTYVVDAKNALLPTRTPSANSNNVDTKLSGSDIKAVVSRAVPLIGKLRQREPEVTGTTAPAQ